MTIRIGTRGSALALWQADYIRDRLLAAHPDLRCERIIFKTRGDHILDRPLAQIGGKGLFTKELEVALADGDIDIAVHSLKDMPTALPDGLVLGAVPVRADVRDCLITPQGADLSAVRTIGTSSLRRACLARRRFPDAEIVSIRGNVQTRAERVLAEGDRRVDLVVLAMAGVTRLKMPLDYDTLNFSAQNPERWIPAASQGALAVECRDGDTQTLDLLAPIHHAGTAACVAAERAFLRAVEGDCRVPVGGYATVDRGTLRLKAFVGAPDGSAFVEQIEMGDATDAIAIGERLASQLLDAGGRDILAALRG